MRSQKEIGSPCRPLSSPKKLVLFLQHVDDLIILRLQFRQNGRTGDISHCRLSADFCGKGYALRVEGLWVPELGHRFVPHSPLLDPYALALTGFAEWHATNPEQLGKQAHPIYSARAFAADHNFDWQGDTAPRNSWADTIIYETHVRGLTIHPSSNVVHRGRFLGIVEKIPYLQALGITVVELMPVQEFCEYQVDERKLTPEKHF